MNYIGKILPVDGYLVLLKEYLPVDYIKSLTHLYQPLIGIQAVSLYQTLLHDIDLQQDGAPQTHHTLMNYLDLPLDDIFQARLKLEAIGLLKTYKKSQESNDLYTYELQSPFAPDHFFRDAMLSQLLFHHIGDQKYSMLKNHYLQLTAQDKGRNITAAFSEVFQTFTPSLEAVKGISKKEPLIEQSEMDFSWMEQMLKQRMIPVGRVLTTENRRLISQMMLLYNLEMHEIDKSVLWALTDENLLDTEEFKSACHDLFKAKNNNKQIKLTEVNVKERREKEESNSRPMTKEEMLIHELETISPKQLLEDLSNGNHASEQDMKAIQEVMTSQGLPAPVMNVLIHYVLLQTNMKLSKAYLEKIASHWSRVNLKTAKEAMMYAKKERERFQKSVNKKSSYNRKQVSKEIIPDWFKEQKHKQKDQSTAVPNGKLTKEQEAIAARLKQYSDGN